MLRKSLTALSAALLLTTSLAQARKSDEFDAQTRAQAEISYTTEQNTWWKEYVESGKKAAQYIQDISSEKPQAAMWFLLTGGKYGFANRQATAEEAGQMFKAMHNIAKHFGNAANKGQGIEAWKDVAQHRAGQAHLDMIYKKIDELEETNKLLNARLASVEEKLATEKAERERELATERRDREREVGGLRGQIGTLNERIEDLQQRLDQQEEARLTAQQAIQDKLQAHADQMAALLGQADARGADFKDAILRSQEMLIGLINETRRDFKLELKSARKEAKLARKEARAREERLERRLESRIAEAKAETLAAKLEGRARETRGDERLSRAESAAKAEKTRLEERLSRAEWKAQKAQDDLLSLWTDSMPSSGYCTECSGED